MTDDAGAESNHGAGTESRRRLGAAVEPLLAADPARYDVAFTLLLLAFVAVVLVTTLDYGPQTRLMPLVIGVPTLAMLLLLLATQVSPRLGSAAAAYGAGDLFDVSDQLEAFGLAESSGDGGDGADATGRTELVVVLAWVALLFALVVLVGFLAGTFAYLLAFYRVRARQSWVMSLVYTAVVWVAAVVVFKALLNTPLYEGLLEVEVPLPF